MSVEIEIKGVGFSGTIEVNSGETYCDALTRAGFGNPDDLDLSVGGQTVEGSDEAVASEAPVIATPKNASLG